MDTVTITVQYLVRGQPTASADPVWLVESIDPGGRFGVQARCQTERAAIEAALAPGLRKSPPGTTAEIGESEIVIRFPAEPPTTINIRRDADTCRLERRRGDGTEWRPFAFVRRVEPQATYIPGSLEEWRAKEMPFTVLQEHSLAYARVSLPPEMAAIIEDVANGRRSIYAEREFAEAQHAIGLRGDYRRDGPDDWEFVDRTPPAIRADAWRADSLMRSWLPYCGYAPVRGVREIDVIYRERMEMLCRMCHDAILSGAGKTA